MKTNDPNSGASAEDLLARVKELEAALTPFAMAGHAMPAVANSAFKTAARAMPGLARHARRRPALSVVGENAPRNPSLKVLSETDLADLVAVIVRAQVDAACGPYPEFLDALIEAVGAYTCSTGEIIEQPRAGGPDRWRFAFRAGEGAQSHGWPMAAVAGGTPFRQWIKGISESADCKV